MSYDLRVASHSEPTAELLERIVRDRGAVVEAGEPHIVRRGDRGVSIEVWAPVRCEVEDLDDELAAAVLAPRWLTEITLPYAAAKADVNLARTLARRLAEACDGAALDPQKDGLLWPRAGRRRYQAPAREDRIPILNLTWVLTSWEHQHLPERWLRLVQRIAPEAAPVRYGDFEPLQERVEPGREDEFVRFWRDNVAADFSLGFFWSCRRPFYGGSFAAPIRPERERDRPGLLAAHIGTELDARALNEQPWRAAVVDLFTAVADEVDAVYAAGYVERGVLASARGLAYDGHSESPAEFSLLQGRWLGVPPVPAWLTWFGRGYRGRLEVGEQVGRGILLRVGDRARAAAELASEFPRLPAEILAAPDRQGPAGWLPEQ